MNFFKLTRTHLIFSCFCIYFTDSIAVVFSEIMPDPTTTDEWIELYNNNHLPADISNWKITDDAAGNCTFPNGSGIIPPFGFAVIAKNQSTLRILSLDSTVLQIIPLGWSVLNNDSDNLVLLDPASNARDNIQYGGELQVIKDRSFERIFRKGDTDITSNWGSCAALSGHTAGSQNSLQSSPGNGIVKIWAIPNPFSPDNDGFDDQTVLHFELPGEMSRITIEIFDLHGRSVRRLVSNIPAGTSQPNIKWDGLDDKGNVLPIGRYIIIIESIDSTSGRTYKAKSTIVIAGQL